MVTDLCCHLTSDSRGAWHTCSSRIISEMLPEIHKMEKCDFLKSIINIQIILFSVTSGRKNLVHPYFIKLRFQFYA